MRAISKAVQHASDEHSEEFKQCNYSGSLLLHAGCLAPKAFASKWPLLFAFGCRGNVKLFLLCCAADVATVADSLKVSSDDFGAALQRVPPSLTRGMQIVSETGTSRTRR